MAPARQQQRKGCRKKLSSTILTSTPVKEALREQQRERKAKKLALDEKKKAPKPSKPKKTQIRKRKPKNDGKQKSKKSSRSLPVDEESSDTDVNEGDVCNDDSDDDVEDGTSVRPIRRSANIDGLDPNAENCLVCGEFGRDREWWYRCRVCALWAHEAFTSATTANNYVCDYCEERQE